MKHGFEHLDCRMSNIFYSLYCADWFKGYAQKPVHPVYRTSNSDYGARPPSVHTMPTRFSGKTQAFSEVRYIKDYSYCQKIVKNMPCKVIKSTVCVIIVLCQV